MRSPMSLTEKPETLEAGRGHLLYITKSWGCFRHDYEGVA